MTARRPWYPTSLEKYQNPVTAVYQKQFTKNAGGVVNTGYGRVGTEIHGAVNEAFKYLRSNKQGLFTGQSNPSAKQIATLIDQATRVAKASLRLHQSQHHQGFVNRIIKQYGSEFLANPNLEVFTEHELVGTLPGGRGQVGGILDLAFRDLKKRTGHIIDLKNVFEADRLATFDNAADKLQTKMYPFLMGQDSAKNGVPLNKIKMTYEINAPFGTVRMPEFVFDQKNIDRLSFEIAQEVARAESIKQVVTERLKSSKSPLTDFKFLANDLIIRHGCDPTQCFACPFQFSCKKRFVDNMHRMNRVEDGVTASTEYSQWRATQDRLRQMDEAPGFQQELYYRDTLKRDALYAKARRATLDATGIDKDLVLKQMQSEMQSLRESTEAAKFLKRGRFEDSVSRGKVQSALRMSYSLLDQDFRHGWMHNKVMNALNWQARSMIRAAADAFEMRHELIEDDVMDRVFGNKDFVSQFYDKVQRNISNEIKKSGLNVTDDTIGWALNRPDKILTKDVALMVSDGIAKETIQTIHRVDAQRIYAKIAPREQFLAEGIDAMVGRAVDSGLIERNPELFLNEVAGTASARGIQQRFRLSAPRFPLPAIAGAMLLSYIAGTANIQNQVARKIDKTSERMRDNRKRVETGEHNATYTAVRRLLHTDFGSPLRPGNPVSSKVSRLAAAGWGKIKSYLDRGFMASLRDSVAKFRSDLGIKDIRELDPSENPAVLMGAAGLISFAGLGILSHVKTTRQVGQETEARKARLKRPVNPGMGDTDSQMQTPESTLRKGYKQHTPFGSPLVLAKYSARILESVPLEKVGKILGRWGAGAWANMTKQAGKGTVSRFLELFMPEKAAITASNAVYDAGSHVKHAANRAYLKVREAEQHLASKYSSRTAGENAELLKERMNANLSREGMKSLLRRNAPDAVLATTMSAGRRPRSERMPVVESRAPRTDAHEHRMVVTTHSRSHPVMEPPRQRHANKAIIEIPDALQTSKYRAPGVVSSTPVDLDPTFLAPASYHVPRPPVYVDHSGQSVRARPAQSLMRGLNVRYARTAETAEILSHPLTWNRGASHFNDSDMLASIIQANFARSNTGHYRYGKTFQA